MVDWPEAGLSEQGGHEGPLPRHRRFPVGYLHRGARTTRTSRICLLQLLGQSCRGPRIAGRAVMRGGAHKHAANLWACPGTVQNCR